MSEMVATRPGNNMTDHTTDVAYKRCPKCGEIKPATAEFFHRCSSHKDGLQVYCRLCRAAYCAANTDARKAYISVYYAENAGIVKARRRTYYAENTDKERAQQAAYRANNPNVFRTSIRRRRARKHDLPATFTTDDWLRCLDYWQHRCAVCGRPQGLWHTLAQDHWIPLSKGGGYTSGNVLPLCHGDGGCNNRKHNADPHEWLTRTFGPRKAAFIQKRINAYFEWAVAHD